MTVLPGLGFVHTRFAHTGLARAEVARAEFAHAAVCSLGGAGRGS
jgi:hypothetical protein